MHLIMDAHATNTGLLSNTDKLKALLLELVDAVGMKAISEPDVREYRAGNGYERGLSGVIFLAESSITVHTYPEYGFVFIDVFSCREFDYKDIKQNLANAFGIAGYTSYIFDRGITKGIITPATLRGGER